MDYDAFFAEYCRENDLDIRLSFDMPEGYETANGMFDPDSNVVFVNARLLEGRPDADKLFALFHELRHASQYLRPEQFDELIVRSRNYVVGFDGVCHKLADGEWKTCHLDGSGDYFTQMYLGQPYEVDANRFACERVKELLGDPPRLRELFSLWMPKTDIPGELYRDLYRRIDSAVEGGTLAPRRA